MKMFRQRIKIFPIFFSFPSATRKIFSFYIINNVPLLTCYFPRTLNLVVLHGEDERILDLGVDVSLVAPDHAHNCEDEEDEGEHEVGAQHPPVLLWTQHHD